VYGKSSRLFHMELINGMKYKLSGDSVFNSV
jgi:hypothetical protein